MGKLTVVYEGDVVAALTEDGRPLRATIREVLGTSQGKGVLNLASAWAGRRVVVVELPAEAGASDTPAGIQ